jgi:Predicted transcriptional regulator
MSKSGEDSDISILFELASNRRASILFEVEKQGSKMQQIAKTLDMTVTETFRHLQRLTEAKLVEKKVDGTYAITSLGKLATGVLSGFNFYLKNGDYFLEHDVSCLPYEFVDRLGELTSSERFDGVLPSLNKIRQIVFSSEEFIWVMSDQVDSSHVPVTNEKVRGGLEFKFIMQKDLAKTIQDSENLKERRYIERVPAAILINEKEAYVSLRRINGVIDHMGFYSTDSKFRKWCQDVFLHYWQTAQHW